MNLKMVMNTHMGLLCGTVTQESPSDLLFYVTCPKGVEGWDGAALPKA